MFERRINQRYVLIVYQTTIVLLYIKYCQIYLFRSLIGCYFVSWFSSNSRIFHSCGDVSIALGSNFDLYSALMAIEPWGFFTVTRGIRVLCSYPSIRDTHACSRAFSSGAVTHLEKNNASKMLPDAARASRVFEINLSFGLFSLII